MAPRSPTLAVIVVTLLAACATTTTTETQTRTDPTYLTGLTSEYSIRLDELRARDPSQPGRLPNAVIGGDETLTIAASMFQKEEFLGLDMVIQNQTEEPITLLRENLQLFDALGNRLIAVDDFEGAEQCGLRAKAGARRDYASHPMASDATPSSIPRNTSGSSADYLSKSTPGTQSISIDTASASAEDFNWMSDLTEVERTTAPLSLHIGGNENRPYWAYWRTHPDVEYPVTAMITLNNKRLIMKFDRD